MDNSENKNNEVKEENLFALAVANQDDDSFPVLKALQGYIEAEREKARKKQTQMTICFLICILVLVITFFTVGALFIGQMWKHEEKQRDTIFALLTNNKNLPTTYVQQSQPAVVPETKIEQPVEQPKDERIDLLVSKLDMVLAENEKLRNQVEESQKKQAQASIVEKSGSVSTVPQKTVTNKGTKVQRGIITKLPSKMNPEEKKEQSVAVAEKTEEVVSAVQEPVAKQEVAPTEEKPVAKEEPVVVKPQRDEKLVLRVKKEGKNKIPKGYDTEEISLILPNKARVPWRMLMADDTGDAR